MIKRIITGDLEENCYIVYSGKTAVVIDPGCEAEKIMESIFSLGVNVEAVLLTHGHYDHIGAAEAIREKTEAPIYCSSEEKEMLMNPELNLSEGKKDIISFLPDKVYSDGEIIRFGELEFKFMLTPGHTSGSAVIFQGDNLFTGDTLFSNGYGRTDLPTGDAHQMWVSLKKLLSLPENYNVFPGHGDFSCLKRRG